MLIKNIYSNYY